jgi:hypothetical protein
MAKGANEVAMTMDEAKFCVLIKLKNGHTNKCGRQNITRYIAQEY